MPENPYPERVSSHRANFSSKYDGCALAFEQYPVRGEIATALAGSVVYPNLNPPYLGCAQLLHAGVFALVLTDQTDGVFAACPGHTQIGSRVDSFQYSKREFVEQFRVSP